MARGQGKSVGRRSGGWLVGLFREGGDAANRFVLCACLLSSAPTHGPTFAFQRRFGRGRREAGRQAGTRAARKRLLSGARGAERAYLRVQHFVLFPSVSSSPPHVCRPTTLVLFNVRLMSCKKCSCYSEEEEEDEERRSVRSRCVFFSFFTFTTASAPLGSLAPVVIYAHVPGETWIESGSTPAVIRPTT